MLGDPVNSWILEQLKEEMSNWRVFERVVHMLSSSEYDSDYTVIPNTSIRGFISKRSRQIDVLVEYRHNSDLTKRIIIDAKYRQRAVNINDVEAFEGLMRDVGAKRGILISAKKPSKSAKLRAEKHIGLRIVLESEFDDFNIFDWDRCHSCPKGLVLWDTVGGVFEDGIPTIQSHGKCDMCGQFHIWCWGCGNRKILELEDMWRCTCNGPWFWLTSVEPESSEEGDQWEANYLILVMLNYTYEIVDRHPLSKRISPQKAV